MQRKPGILVHKDTKQIAMLAAVVRLSGSVPSRYRCHLVTIPTAGGKPVQVADIRLEMN